jgi:hypothetical protein
MDGAGFPGMSMFGTYFPYVMIAIAKVGARLSHFCYYLIFTRIVPSIAFEVERKSI